MKSFLLAITVFVLTGFSIAQTIAQTRSTSPSKNSVSRAPATGSSLALNSVSTLNVPSEAGGAFMNGSKCDADEYLYLRKYSTDRPLLSTIVKIDHDGKRVAVFDPAAFSHLALDRADAFSPASDGGLFEIAQSGILKPRTYVLRFSSDGSPSTPTRLDADFEIYSFAAFLGGNFLVSGVRRDIQNKNDHGRNFTAVFSADGRELAQLSFRGDKKAAKIDSPRDTSPHDTSGNDTSKNDISGSAPPLDLADAEAGIDGNIYVLHWSAPALVYVISPDGQIFRTLKIAGPLPGALPTAFHLSINRLAVSFWNEGKQRQTILVVDAQTGQQIASYADTELERLGPWFACYSANAGVFTFLKLGEGNSLQVIRAEAK